MEERERRFAEAILAAACQWVALAADSAAVGYDSYGPFWGPGTGPWVGPGALTVSWWDYARGVIPRKVEGRVVGYISEEDEDISVRAVAESLYAKYYRRFLAMGESSGSGQ